MLRRVVLATSLLALIAAGGLVFDYWMSANVTPGAGQTYQDAPDQVAAGQMFVVTLRVGAWGAGGAADDRFSKVRLHMKRSDESDYLVREPTTIEREGERIAYRFRFDAPDGAVQLDYYFTFVFDRRPRRVDGSQPIVVLP